MFLRYYTLRQLSPEGTSGGLGSGTLDDLDNEEESGADTNTIDEPTDEEKAAAEKMEADKAEADKIAADAQKAVDDKKAEEEAAAKAAEEKGDKDSDADEDEDLKFWDDVNALRGEDTFDVDFGDVDPLSPEGVLIRDQALEAHAVSKFEAYIEANHPKAFAYLAHVMEGGKDEDFFKVTEAVTELPTEEELENDPALQEQLVRADLKARGLTDKAIDRTVKGLKEDDELEDEAKVALTNKAKANNEAIQAAKVQTQQLAAERSENIKQMSTYVDQVVATGKVGNIVIPEKDRKAFATELKKDIQYADKEFVLVTKLNKDNIDKVFKEKFFSFKNGDVTELIEKAARTVNANRLRRTITDDKRPKGTQTNGKEYVTLGDVE